MKKCNLIRAFLAAGLSLLIGIAMPLSAQDYPFEHPMFSYATSIRSAAERDMTFGPLPEFAGNGRPPPEIRSTDLIGWSSDGTNDEDDWAATAIVWAMLAKAGLQDQFVHFDYNNRFNDSSSSQIAKGIENIESTVGGALEFDFHGTKVYNDMDPVQRREAIEHVRYIVEELCGPDRIFYYVQAGTFEVAYQALKLVSPEQRQYCILVSHSNINEWSRKWTLTQPEYIDELSHEGRAHGMVDCVNPINPPAGIPAGLGAGYFYTSRMGHQDGRPQFGGPSYDDGMDWISWMEDSPVPQYRWTYDRVKLVRDIKGGLDASDGGMMFALISGETDFGSRGGIAAFSDFLDESLSLPSVPTPTVTHLELINVNTNEVIRTITGDVTIDPSTLPSDVTLRAVTDPVTVDSVLFRDAGSLVFEDVHGSIYTIREDANGFILPWDFAERTYDLSVTPRLNSSTGSAFSARITFGEGGDPIVPTVSIETAINASDELEVTVNAQAEEGFERVVLWTQPGGSHKLGRPWCGLGIWFKLYLEPRGVSRWRLQSHNSGYCKWQWPENF